MADVYIQAGTFGPPVEEDGQPVLGSSGAYPILTVEDTFGAVGDPVPDEGESSLQSSATNFATTSRERVLGAPHVSFPSAEVEEEGFLLQNFDNTGKNVTIGSAGRPVNNPEDDTFLPPAVSNNPDHVFAGIGAPVPVAGQVTYEPQDFSNNPDLTYYPGGRPLNPGQVTYVGRVINVGG